MISFNFWENTNNNIVLKLAELVHKTHEQKNGKPYVELPKVKVVMNFLKIIKKYQ